MAHQDDDDLFAPVHHVEETFIQQGRQDGLRDGRQAGLNEGRELGVQKGFELGLEVGYFTGCVRLWRQLQRLDPAVIPARAERSLAQLEEALAAFPLYNPQDERLHELLERAQGKFKAVASMLGMLQEYFPKEGPVTYAY